MNKLESLQLAWLLKARKLSNIFSFFRIHPGFSSFHLNTWSYNSLGYHINQLVNYRLSSIFLFIHYFLLEVIVHFSSTYNFVGLPSPKFFLYNKLFVTWAKNSDINNGVFYDRYTQCSSNDFNDVLWLLIFLEPPNPHVIINNAVSCYRFSYLSVVRKIFIDTNPLHSLWALRRNVFMENNTVTKCKSIETLVEQIFSTFRIDLCFMSYEAQPFQQSINYYLNVHYPDVKTYGYIHSFLPSLPCEYHNRAGCPMNLIINGDFQKPLLTKYLNWPAESVTAISPLRYNKKFYTPPKENFIYLPYNFYYDLCLVDAIDFGVNFFKYITLNEKVLIIKNHPLQKHSQKHHGIISLITHLANQKSNEIFFYTSPFNIENNLSNKIAIVIGSSAILFELINSLIDVIHISNEPILDILSPLLFPVIKVKQIHNNVFYYQSKGSDPLYVLSEQSSPQILSNIFL